MAKSEKVFDLEERTLRFAKECIDLCRGIRRDVTTHELVRQLIRSAGSVGANYREANDTGTRKDFTYRISICRKEAKESAYWLELLVHADDRMKERTDPLMDEARQLSRIFATIAIKCQKSP